MSTYRPSDKDELKALIEKGVKLYDIDTGGITDMSCLFLGSHRKDFRGIEDWDVSHVTDMYSMFNGARAFNQPIGGWDVSNVTDMRYMFSNAKAFNQPIDGWDVSRVKKRKDMFEGTAAFSRPKPEFK